MNTIVTLRIIFSLGIFQGLMAIVIFLSCRCVNGFRLGSKLMKYSAFRRFFKYHTFFWWPFWISVVAHVVLAIKPHRLSVATPRKQAGDSVDLIRQGGTL